MKKALMSVTLFALLVAPAAVFAGGDLDVSVETLARTEFIEDWDLDDSEDDRTDFTFWRSRIGLNSQVSDDIGATVEVQAWGHWGSNGSCSSFSGFGFPCPGDNIGSTNVFGTADTSSGDVHLYQGFIDLDNIGGSLLSLQVGRQEHTLGNELHMGDNSYYTGQTFDGVRGNLDFEGWDLDFFMYKVNEMSDDDLGSSDDTDFWGLTSNFELEENHNLEPYILHLRDGMGVSFSTIGALYHHDRGDGMFDWAAEFALQTGELDSDTDLSSWVFEGNFGINFGNDSAHRVSFGALVLSDGDDPDDVEAFIPLFTDSHARAGKMDWFTTSPGPGDALHNLTNLYIDWSYTSGNNTFGAAYHNFTCTEDVFCGGDDDLGSEIDLWWEHNSGEHVAFAIGLGQFMGGDVYGSDVDDAMRANAMLRFRN
jgi:hypothetical protein